MYWNAVNTTRLHSIHTYYTLIIYFSLFLDSIIQNLAHLANLPEDLFSAEIWYTFKSNSIIYFNLFWDSILPNHSPSSEPEIQFFQRAYFQLKSDKNSTQIWFFILIFFGTQFWQYRHFDVQINQNGWPGPLTNFFQQGVALL